MIIRSALIIICGGRRPEHLLLVLGERDIHDLLEREGRERERVGLRQSVCGILTVSVLEC